MHPQSLGSKCKREYSLREWSVISPNFLLDWYFKTVGLHI